MEYFSNVLNHRPKFIKFTYDDFMKLHHSPNSNWEVKLERFINRKLSIG